MNAYVIRHKSTGHYFQGKENIGPGSAKIYFTQNPAPLLNALVRNNLSIMEFEICECNFELGKAIEINVGGHKL